MGHVVQQSHEDRYRRNRARAMIAFTVFFALWQLADIFSHASRGPLRIAFWLVSCAGIVGWLVQNRRLKRMQRELVDDPAFGAAMADERWQLQRLRSCAVALVAVALAQGAFIVASTLGAELPMMTVARLTIVVGVTASIAAALVQERD
jgi:hypothetical protein